MTDVGLNPGLLHHWRIVYPLGKIMVINVVYSLYLSEFWSLFLVWSSDVGEGFLSVLLTYSGISSAVVGFSTGFSCEIADILLVVVVIVVSCITWGAFIWCGRDGDASYLGVGFLCAELICGQSWFEVFPCFFFFVCLSPLTFIRYILGFLEGWGLLSMVPGTQMLRKVSLTKMASIFFNTFSWLKCLLKCLLKFFLCLC